MMEHLRLEKDKKIEDNIIKMKKSLFIQEKERDDTTVKDIGNLFRLQKKEMKQLDIEQLEILGTILSTKKIIIKQ